MSEYFALLLNVTFLLPHIFSFPTIHQYTYLLFY